MQSRLCSAEAEVASSNLAGRASQVHAGWRPGSCELPLPGRAPEPQRPKRFLTHLPLSRDRSRERPLPARPQARAGRQRRCSASSDSPPPARRRFSSGLEACSTRALSAVFICSNPASVFASVPLTSPTRSPVKRSDCTKRLRPPSSRSMRRPCSPSKSPGGGGGRASGARGSPRRRERWA